MDQERGRKIIHLDMDAFYASVEQRDDNDLVGKPVVVGGLPGGRGVVCTASYEARTYGIHAGMPSDRAVRLCPDAVFLKPDFPRYTAVSKQVKEIFNRHTDLVEPLSLDEAYLDVTINRLGLSSATEVAGLIRDAVTRETRLTVSAGVGPNKFVAKVASDMRKPDGLMVVPPEDVQQFVRELPVRKVPGIGPVTGRECARRGIRFCADFLRFDPQDLEMWFGKSGRHFWQLAQGIDTRPVRPPGQRRSLSVEDTFSADLVNPGQAEGALMRLCEMLSRRAEKNQIHGRTVTVKVKFSDFRQVTRSTTLPEPVWKERELWLASRPLLWRAGAEEEPVRLLGIGLSQLSARDEAEEEGGQLPLPF